MNEHFDEPVEPFIEQPPLTTEQEIGQMVDQKIQQRAQRRAMAMSLVTLARIHDDRPPELVTERDADVTMAILDLVESLVRDEGKRRLLRRGEGI